MGRERAGHPRAHLHADHRILQPDQRLTAVAHLRRRTTRSPTPSPTEPPSTTTPSRSPSRRPSTACAMLTCDFGALGQASINEAAGTAVLTVPPSQPVTSLAPTFTLSSNATINPASGSTQNFTNPVVYRVTAEDGTTFKDYTVSVQSYAAWAHSGSLFILTTPDGANLPGGASVSHFPLLVRLNSEQLQLRRGATRRPRHPLHHRHGSAASLSDRAVGRRRRQGRRVGEDPHHHRKLDAGNHHVLGQDRRDQPVERLRRFQFLQRLRQRACIWTKRSRITTGTTSPSNVGAPPRRRPDRQSRRTFASGQASSAAPTSPACPRRRARSPRAVWIRSRSSATRISSAGASQQSSQKKVVMQLGSARRTSTWIAGSAAPTSRAPPRPHCREWTYICSHLPDHGHAGSMSTACWMPPPSAAR